MIVTVSEAKGYLRVDHSDDDVLIGNLILTAQKLCMDVMRAESEEELLLSAYARIAVLYAVAYLYEHREEADHNALALSVRALLLDRNEAF